MLFPAILCFHGALALAAARPLPFLQTLAAQAAQPDLGRVAEAAGSVGPWTADLEVGALVRAFWGYADDDLGGNSVNGFGFHDVDIWAELPVEGYNFRVSFEADTGAAVLEDAYVHWAQSEALAMTVGSFKPRVLFSNATDPELLVFNERSVLGSFFDQWDIGAQAGGRVLENLDYTVSITNGANGAEKDQLYVLRGEWSFQRQDLPLQEGARGLTDKRDVVLGLVFLQDTEEDNTGLGIDVRAQLEGIALQFEAMSLDDGLGGDVGLKTVPLALSGDSAPWAITASRMFSDTVQFAARFQVTDNADDTNIFSIAADFYPVDGPISLVAEIDRFDGDEDGFALQAGVSMGHSRKR